MSMPREHAESLYHEWIDAVWRRRVITPDLIDAAFVGHWPTGDVEGPAGLESVVAQTHSMFEKLDFAVDLGPLVDGDYVIGRWTGVGSSARGETRFTGNDILRLRNGKVVEYWPATASS
ncbi:ester cyclase [Mycobacterium sp. SMC-4]|uniref:ester cyclase n=1 Tax=Mycobacterium sp. SMC-4 TaxID=2857059 RepID=UPI0021B2A6E5|nr:ester cyclase [Mycobacterium sp. SMC-4]UXA18466.1 ester cyclase [Mycobacterium sp. SMC-4]